jgi:hypothetical protein
MAAETLGNRVRDLRPSRGLVESAASWIRRVSRCGGCAATGICGKLPVQNGGWGQGLDTAVNALSEPQWWRELEK